jgi:hypothetical protein
LHSFGKFCLLGEAMLGLGSPPFLPITKHVSFYATEVQFLAAPSLIFFNACDLRPYLPGTSSLLCYGFLSLSASLPTSYYLKRCALRSLPSQPAIPHLPNTLQSAYHILASSPPHSFATPHLVILPLLYPHCTLSSHIIAASLQFLTSSSLLCPPTRACAPPPLVLLLHILLY